MIVDRMHIEFKELVDKAATLNNPNFQTEQIDLFLSDAQEEFLEQRAYGINFKREYLEETQKRVKDLQSITRNANIITFLNNTDNKPNGTFIQLPSDYRHAINEEVQVTYLDCNQVSTQTRIPVEALTHDKYNNTLANPFTRPSINKVYRLPFGRINSAEYFEVILPVGYTLNTYILRYLKNPAKIDKAQLLTPVGLAGTDQGEMTDESYREIIQLAVRNALGEIGSQLTPDALQKFQTEIE